MPIAWGEVRKSSGLRILSGTDQAWPDWLPDASARTVAVFTIGGLDTTADAE
jgi:hypothetical protein